ncbi:MAG: DUF4019 domain-containing protein [Methylacidiphilales bacterium]|nr:DUF4019 domain-containing protein [Candidatus Methylacidiphilales bacterium]
MKIHCFAFLVVGLLLAITAKGFASPDDYTNDALAISKTMVAQIDAGKYIDSYALSCTALRQKISEQQWSLVLQAVRKPWGAVVSREQKSHTYKPEGIEGLSGECMIIHYQTSFVNMASVDETVVLKWEDGHWRSAGYHCIPKTSDQDAQTDVSETTTTSSSSTTHQPPQDLQQTLPQ